MVRHFIEQYINSRGASLPVDLSEYLIGQYHGSRCVFCGNEHSNRPVYRYNPIEESREIVLGLHACTTCDELHLDAVSVLYPLLELKAANKVLAQRELEDRIYLYNEHQQFTDDVYKFFTYLSRTNENYRTIPFKQCYFCRQLIVGHHAHSIKTVEVPLKLNMLLIGGKVYCCDEHYQLLVSPNRYSRAKCCRCEQHYLIEDDEHTAIMFENSSKYRMCPECTYNAVANIVPYDTLLSHTDNLPIRSQPITRLIAHECSTCQKEFVIDLCMSHNQLSAQHRSAHGIHCLTCYRMGVTKSNKNKFYMNVHSNIFVLLTRVGNMWHYSIMRVVQGNVESHTKAAAHRDLAEAIFIANQEAWNLFPLSKQGELWEDQ